MVQFHTKYKVQHTTIVEIYEYIKNATIVGSQILTRNILSRPCYHSAITISLHLKLHLRMVNPVEHGDKEVTCCSYDLCEAICYGEVESFSHEDCNADYNSYAHNLDSFGA